MNTLNIKLLALFLSFGLLSSLHAMQRPIIFVAGHNNILIINGVRVPDALRRSHSEPSVTGSRLASLQHEPSHNPQHEEQVEPQEQDQIPVVQQAYAQPRPISPVCNGCSCVVQ